ncbi:MAG: hypothetical protein AAB681_00080 [Patescibacteria group bacterium]
MISLVVWFIVSLLVLWLIVMALLWRKENQPHGDVLTEIKPLVNKSRSGIRRMWFLILRTINRARAYMTMQITKLFFMIFPSARAAFEKKDVNTIVEQGPSSDFLVSISKDLNTRQRKSRRNHKNV